MCKQPQAKVTVDEALKMNAHVESSATDTNVFKVAKPCLEQSKRFGLKAVIAAKFIAPGNDAFEFAFDFEDPDKEVARITWEILRKADQKVIRKAEAADSKKISWDGAIDRGVEGFPDHCVNVVHSPYLIRVTLHGSGDKKDSREAEVKVQVADFLISLAPEKHLTEQKDKDVRAQITKLPTESSTAVKLKLKSNIFSTSVKDYYTDAGYKGYEQEWGLGPRIPLLAKVTVFDSKEQKVVAGKALGSARVLWDYADPPQTLTTYLSTQLVPPPDSNCSEGAAGYMKRALHYDPEGGLPKGDNCHADYGGKRCNATLHRSNADTPVLVEADSKVQNFSFKVAKGAKRWWAAFSSFESGGAFEGHSGIVFRPSRMAGDNYSLKAYLEVKQSLDTDAAVPSDAEKTQEIGVFEVWRQVTLSKHFRKNSSVTGVVDKERLKKCFADAYIEIEDKTSTIVTLQKDDYLRLFQEAWLAIPFKDTHPAVFRYSLKFDDYDSTWVGQALTYSDFLALLKTKTKELQQNQIDIKSDTFPANEDEYFNQTIYFVDRLAQQISVALSKDLETKGEEGVHILQFDYVTSLEADAVSKDNSNNPAGLKRQLMGVASENSAHTAGLVIYTTDKGAETTPAHEMGHILFLPHAPYFKPETWKLMDQQNAQGEGINDNMHDGSDLNCMMSYAFNTLGFCGLCMLRLRGWNHAQLNAAGPVSPAIQNIKPDFGEAGKTVDVVLTGIGFGTAKSPVKIAFSGRGVSLRGDAVVDSDKKITATFAIDSTAAGGPYIVTAITSKGESGCVKFYLTPSLTSIEAPHKFDNGNRFTCKIIGKNLTPHMKVNVGSPGLEVLRSWTPKSTEMEVEFKADSGKAPGACEIRTAVGGASSNSLPMFSINPAGAVRGKSTSVVLESPLWKAISKVNKVTAGDGITVSDVQRSNNQITATFAVAGDAPLQKNKVVVEYNDGHSSPAMEFTVKLPAPTISSISRTNAVAGESFEMTVTGTNFKAGDTAVEGDAGVKTGSPAFLQDSATEFRIQVAIAADAGQGVHELIVKTSGGTAKAQFTVEAAAGTPKLTGSIPDLDGAQMQMVRIKGENIPGIQASEVIIQPQVQGGPVLASAVAAEGELRLQIRTGVKPGIYKIAVHTRQRGKSNEVQFRVLAPQPELDIILDMKTGSADEKVELTGKYLADAEVELAADNSGDAKITSFKASDTKIDITINTGSVPDSYDLFVVTPSGKAKKSFEITAP